MCIEKVVYLIFHGTVGDHSTIVVEILSRLIYVKNTPKINPPTDRRLTGYHSDVFKK